MAQNAFDEGQRFVDTEWLMDVTVNRVLHLHLTESQLFGA